MKIILRILAILFLTVNFMYGQSFENKIEKLFELGILDKKQRPIVELIAKQFPPASNARILSGLRMVEMSKAFGRDMSYERMVFIKKQQQKPATEHQNKINDKLREYLDKLNKAGLLLPQLYESFGRAIDSNDYIHIIDFLNDLTTKAEYLEWMSPEKLLSFAEMLFRNEVLDNDNYDRLRGDIQSGSITSNFQLIDYCEYAKFFDLSAYSNDPAVYLEQIHREVSHLLPGLAFTDFAYSIRIDPAFTFDSSLTYKAVISFNCNGRHYTQKSFIVPDSIDMGNKYLGKLSAQEFYQIFNKVLVDMGSSFRMHQIGSNFQFNQPTDYRYFGIIALRKEQTEILRFVNSYMEISYENFTTMPGAKRIAEAISGYRQIGLFEHLSGEEISRATERATEETHLNLNDMLRCFPDLIYSFDSELINLKNPYAELLQELAQISHKAFNPLNISDKFSKPAGGMVGVGFTLNGTAYSTELRFDGDWIDKAFLAFIKKVVKESGINGQFYDLCEGGEGSNIIFLTDEQHSFLKTQKLLQFQGECRTDEE